MPEGVRQVEWAGGRGRVGFWDGLRLLNDLKRVIREVRPDLIQAGPIQRAAFLTALSGFRPLVSTSWGYDLLNDAQRNALWAWATRFTLARSSAMVGDCNTIRKLAVYYGMPDDRIVTFPWGVDIEHFSPGNGTERGGFSLLSTRGWEPIYGVDLIARAFVRVARLYPEVRLTMLGNGSLAGALRRIFQDGGVLERVAFPGQVRRADLPRYYRSADLYVSASHSDGSSISLLEAMACGSPALVSDIPGNKEWVEPGVQGWLFPDGDVSGLAQAFNTALDQRSQLPDMGRAARALVERRADWGANFPRLLDAYQLAVERDNR